MNSSRSELLKKEPEKIVEKKRKNIREIYLQAVHHNQSNSIT
jgi:hypothetical protein